MKNCKGQELPQPYYDLAVMRREKNPNDFYITSYTAHVHNTSPEEAAAELAMELVGSGVIKFETNQKEVSNG